MHCNHTLGGSYPHHPTNNDWYQRPYSGWFQFFSFYWDFPYGPAHIVSWWIFHVHLKKSCIMWLLYMCLILGDDNSVVILFVPLSVLKRSLFLWLFCSFLLITDFQPFAAWFRTSLCVCLPSLEFTELLCLWVYNFYQTWGNLAIISSHIFSIPLSIFAL